jgi:hypothetical protein
MVRFEELQELWQNQPQPESPAVDARGMTGELRKFGRRQNFIFSVKVVLMAWQIWYCLSKLGVSVLSVIGEAVFVAGIVSILATDWRNQSGIARLDFTRPSAGFVNATLDRLRDPNAPFRRWFWLHMLLLCVGANLLISSRWASSTPPQRLLSHATATAAPFACWAVALTIRVWRYRWDYRPLTERLQAMKQALAEQAQ